ncbi:MAG: hypothetical protein ABI865_09350 [Nitrosospira sp.]
MRDDARELLAQGIDPGENRKARLPGRTGQQTASKW